MTNAQSTEISVVGAGVIGLAIAHRLALQGHEVVMIDPEAPGSGASYGNAGTIADYAVLDTLRT
jgi:D-amino-acid dehydrogenase